MINDRDRNGPIVALLFPLKAKVSTSYIHCCGGPGKVNLLLWTALCERSAICERDVRMFDHRNKELSKIKKEE